MFVRELTDEEGQRLVRLVRRSKDPVRLRRAMIVLASAQGRPASDIAELIAGRPDYVREVIHAFNEQGFGALDPKWSGGRAARVDEATREAICRIALARPRDLGEPFATWSLTKLAAHLASTGVCEISRETLRGILKARGISFQRTTTWKASTDRDFEAKKNRILELYDHLPDDGRVLCVDEFGPVNLQPRGGMGWFRRGRPARLRATYTRTAGVRHLFGALDLATGTISYRIRARKRWRELFAFLKVLRARYRHGRLYVICDNFSPHRKHEVAAWCAANDVELVFLPTYASWLNWIESEFAALRSFTLNGTDYASHDEQAAAIRAYLRWRNARATPKRNFAIDSRIRRPSEITDYPAKVA